MPNTHLTRMEEVSIDILLQRFSRVGARPSLPLPSVLPRSADAPRLHSSHMEESTALGGPSGAMIPLKE